MLFCLITRMHYFCSPVVIHSNLSNSRFEIHLKLTWRPFMMQTWSSVVRWGQDKGDHHEINLFLKLGWAQCQGEGLDYVLGIEDKYRRKSWGGWFCEGRMIVNNMEVFVVNHMHVAGNPLDCAIYQLMARCSWLIAAQWIQWFKALV